MSDSEKKDKYRVYGELLTVYGYSAEPGAEKITVNDYNTGKDVTITLDPTLTPAQNAKKYFDKYTKLKRTAEALEEQMKDWATDTLVGPTFESFWEGYTTQIYSQYLKMKGL